MIKFSRPTSADVGHTEHG